VGTGMF